LLFPIFTSSQSVEEWRVTGKARDIDRLIGDVIGREQAATPDQAATPHKVAQAGVDQW
jgi:hypothetical protein